METRSQSSPSGALIIGVTGMVGISLAQALKEPGAAGSPWTVYGASRRPPPAWFPEETLDLFIQLDALDPDATVRKLSPLAPHVTHLFWVALAARDTEEENVAANSAMLANVLHALTSASAGSSLRHVALQTGTKHYFGPFLDPAALHRIGPVDVPFREEAPRLPHPVFYYALEDILSSHSPKLTWTVHRSSIILGASSRSIYNMLLSCAAYALICRHEGSPFVFPGTTYTWCHFCDASDSGLLARQQIWAATTPAAAYKTFNCTNGDVFTWRSFWKLMSELMGVEFVDCPSETVGPEWVARMKGKAAVWDAIVAENKLVKTKLEEITCFDAIYAVMNFNFQHVCSMNKSREFGFFESVDTLRSVKKWVRKLKEMNLIPGDREIRETCGK